MVIIADKKIPEPAKKRLEKYGQVIRLKTSGITYPSISGHPDIFFCRVDNELVVSPSLPGGIFKKTEPENISLVTAGLDTGSAYPATARLNAVVTPGYIIHNGKYTDPVLKKKCAGREFIHVNQGYTRCNLIPLENDRFITSDRGIQKALQKKGLDVLYVNPQGILLPGFPHGFIGGTCGVFENMVFFIGNPDLLPEGEKIKDFLKEYRIIRLYDGPLFDGGSLLFL